jgi:hypothetical protein
MRKLLITALLVMAGGAVLYAQHNTREEVLANIDLAGGTYSQYPTGQPSPSKAPKGYKPFYLSHMGRHGARYIGGTGTYTKILEVLEGAHSRGVLTAEGEKIYQAYKNLYPNLANREGVLTLKGQMQHRQIAAQIHRDYPELFKGKTKASALSTTSHRVILSMAIFMDQMKEMDRDFTYQVDYGFRYYPMLVPESHDNPAYVKRVPFPKETLEVYDKFAAEVFDENAVLARWFTSTDSLGMAKDSFLHRMSSLVSDFSNLDFAVSDTLSGIFTDEERYHMWQIQNWSDYLYTARAKGIDTRRCREMSVTVKDIIDRYEEDVRDGVSLRCRFSHDTALMPLISYLGVNGMDICTDDPHELENIWRSFSVPMACNLQIVFFRNSKQPDDVLIQVLLNGFQATLPLPAAAPGFYRWSDFKERFDHLEI